jgi:hypothetical protein
MLESSNATPGQGRAVSRDPAFPNPKINVSFSSAVPAAGSRFRRRAPRRTGVRRTRQRVGGRRTPAGLPGFTGRPPPFPARSGRRRGSRSHGGCAGGHCRGPLRRAAEGVLAEGRGLEQKREPGLVSHLLTPSSMMVRRDSPRPTAQPLSDQEENPMASRRSPLRVGEQRRCWKPPPG